MGWYNANWLYRKKLSVDHTKVSANETDFPVLVKLDSDAGLAANARSDGYDLVVTRSDGTTECAYDRVYFNESTGELVLHFLANSLSSSADTDFYLYYGNSGQATDKAAPTTVWANYAGVWHLNESSGTRYDSTSNNNDLTDNNTVTSATGKMYTGASFDLANTEYLSIADGSQTGLDLNSDFTISYWMKLASLPSDNAALMFMVNKDIRSSDRAYSSFLMNDDQHRLVYYGSNQGAESNTKELDSAYTSGDVGEWKHIVQTVDLSTQVIDFYVNASAPSATYFTGTTFYDIKNSAAPFHLGAGYNGSPERYYDGMLEEVRIRTGYVSSDWDTTEYNNQNSPSTFYTLGSEELYGFPTVYEEAQALTLTLPATTVTTEQNVTVSPSAQSIVGSLPAPTVTPGYSVTVNPSVQSLVGALPGVVVTAQTSVTVLPTVQSLVGTLPDVTVSTGGAPSINGYNGFKSNNLKGLIDLDNDTIKVMLVSDSYTFDEDAHEYADDISTEITGTGYTAGGATLSGVSITLDTGTDTAKFDASDVVWNTATFTARGAIIYKDTGDPATSPLIAYFDFGANISPDNENLTIQWGDGIITYT